MNKSDIKKNSIIEVEITELSSQGLGVAKIDGFVVFVNDALIGETGTILIHRVENTYALAAWDKLHTKSKDRVEVTPRNKVLTNIIPLQHMSYEKQLEFKTQLVKDAFSKVEGLDENVILDKIGMENKWHYRNKTQVNVQANKNSMETGVISRRPNRMVPVNNFKVNLAGMDEIVSGVRDVLISFNEKGYNPKTNTGNIRQIIVRKGCYTGQAMVIIVTRSRSLFPKAKIVPAIIEKFPNVVSIVHSMNNEKHNQGLGSELEVIYGEPTYQEIVLGNQFNVGATAYFKGNTLQVETLITTLIDSLDLKGSEVVLDANCGIGVTALALASHVHAVVGIDRSAESIELSTANAVLNDIINVSFDTRSLDEVLQSADKPFDVVIVDPATRGLNAHSITNLINAKPNIIVYISSDLTTLTKDIAKITQKDYKITKIVPIDMFPQTTHVETVVRLTRKK